jgi:hypothetical protein
MIWQIALLDAISRPMGTANDRQEHWNSVYAATPADALSWFQPQPRISLKLISRTGIGRDAAVVDIGGGASSLAACLLNDGFSDVTVLDVAEPALMQSRRALGEREAEAKWITADVTRWTPNRRYDLWHDRAVLHFLTSEADQDAYAEALYKALAPQGWAIIGGFAPGGPTQCSGLDVVQHDAESLERLLGIGFKLMETHGEVHITPQGREQRFRYHIFERSIGA